MQAKVARENDEAVEELELVPASRISLELCNWYICRGCRGCSRGLVG